MYDEESVALQALEFWSTVAELEIEYLEQVRDTLNLICSSKWDRGAHGNSPFSLTVGFGDGIRIFLQLAAGVADHSNDSSSYVAREIKPLCAFIFHCLMRQADDQVYAS